jgi:leucyl-tRNA synthetase
VEFLSDEYHIQQPRPRYGQTNCFVGTAIKYGVFAANDKEAYVCTQRAARNMTFQGIFDVRGQLNQLAELEGTAIVGTKIKAPLSVYPEVYVLPMDNVLPTKVQHLAAPAPITAQLIVFFRVRVLSPPSHRTRLMTTQR